MLLRNSGQAGHHWAGVRLQGVRCNRDAIGAKLTWSAGGVRRSRQKNGGGSYLSSHDPREVLGLGRATAVDWLEVTWPAPAAKTERFTNVPIDRYVTIVEGKGNPGVTRILPAALLALVARARMRGQAAAAASQTGHRSSARRIA